MPSVPELDRGARRRRLLVAVALAAPVLVALGGLAFLPGCQAGGPRAATHGPTAYPPSPQPPQAINLGNLRTSAPPTEAEVQLAEFLFGAPPAAELALVSPVGVTVDDERVLICDIALDGLFEWTPGNLRELPVSPRLQQPFAVLVLPDDSKLIGDRSGVQRVSADGRPMIRYTRPDGPMRASSMLPVDDELWVTNVAANTIDIFTLANGQYQRSIGGFGAGRGEFNVPRGLARMADGSVAVIDMLNNRVQVLTKTGRWMFTLGMPGDVAGTFGRPRGIAVGPDGTVFVTDAFSQRVHAFGADGAPLLDFGEPSRRNGGLLLPDGIAISQSRPQTTKPLPADVEPLYYVLVAEQLHDPGVRVFAWLGNYTVLLAGSAPPDDLLEPTNSRSSVINPHWKSDRCTACHGEQPGGGLAPIALDTSDAVCLSCHDGVKAPADPHPIGRPMNSEGVTSPDDWPAPGGMIGCLTCHDILQQCARDAQRPPVNAAMLRGFDPQRPLSYCTNCHKQDVSGRFSPHQQRDPTGRIREDACLFCHTKRPPIPEDGRRQFDPHLRANTSQICLNCHIPHWDLSPRGHVDRPVPDYIREWMLQREGYSAQQAKNPELRPAILPLGDGKVTCYTCHNPHYNGLFPANSELGAMAENPQDRASALRTDWIDLCSDCHHR